MIVTLAACGKDNPFGPNPDDVQFASQLGIDLASMTRTSSGLYVQDTVVGTGDLAMPRDSVFVTFTMWLPDGELVDGGNFGFVLDQLEVIAGVDEGVTGMQVGGIRKLVIPSSLAYGREGTRDGIIPQFAVLVFEIELTAIVSPPG